MINKTYLGIDVGSTTVKMVVLDKERNLLAWRYQRSQGQPRHILLNEIENISQKVDLSHIAAVGLTGSGGLPIAKLIGGQHVNELIAQTRAVGEFYPQARTVIEIGGQDSKFLSMAWDEKSHKMHLVDMVMNNLCAAGTGSFLDQQAERLGIFIEKDFAKLALRSETPARIAGRCTVFAKSDMIHLQQKGTPLADILAGLAMALARNFKSVIGKGKAFTPPIIFQGGVAYNQGVVRAFENVLKLKSGELIIPKHHHLMPALGTALIALDEEMDGNLPPFEGFVPLENYILYHKNEEKQMPVLPTEEIQFAVPQKTLKFSNDNDGKCQSVYLGIDVGSITTKVVLIDQDAQVVARRYWYTEGKPLEVMRDALFEVGQEIGKRVKVIGVGVTGSGRYLTADFVGGDVVRSEITAQARAAMAIDPTVEWGWLYSRHGTIIGICLSHLFLGLFAFYIIGFKIILT
jgi:predicted CoA-substrate-specific enzyme activase